MTETENTIGISIPYGSIKRERRLKQHGKQYEFQFLMVQLKDVTELIFPLSGIISIPYGSIKR